MIDDFSIGWKPFMNIHHCIVLCCFNEDVIALTHIVLLLLGGFDLQCTVVIGRY